MLNNLLRKFLRYSTAGPALVRFYLIPRVKLHHIHTSDADFHNHPWNAVSFIFGRYLEALEDGTQHTRIGFNYLPANRRHKVTVLKPVWTLFIHGKRVNEGWKYGAATKPWEGSDQERNDQ